MTTNAYTRCYVFLFISFSTNKDLKLELLHFYCTLPAFLITCTPFSEDYQGDFSLRMESS